jgi:hypothetical protein
VVVGVFAGYIVDFGVGIAAIEGVGLSMELVACMMVASEVDSVVDLAGEDSGYIEVADMTGYM